MTLWLGPREIYVAVFWKGFFMSSEITVALIAAFVSLVGAATTLIVGLRNVKIERDKLQSEKYRLKIEAERLKSEMEKLGLETKKFQVDSDDARNMRNKTDQVILEIEKQKALALEERRRDIYPEMLELVYRLRNNMRENLISYESNLEESKTYKTFGLMIPDKLGEELYLLTENLFKYRAFIDEESYQLIHRFKRLLQDAQVIFDRIGGRALDIEQEEKWSGSIDDFEEKELRKRDRYMVLFRESENRLKEIYNEVDELYPKITSSVQNHIEAILNR